MSQHPATDAPQHVPIGFLDGGWRAHLLFAFLTALFCAGPLLHPFDFPLAPPMADPANTQWNFWWVHQVLRGHAGPDGGFMFCPVLFYPLGADLAHQTVEYTYALLLWPLRMVTGGIVQHNAALILATYLTAWFTWLAARQFGATYTGAALATIVITLHPYRLGEAHHLNIFSTQWFPLVLYLVLRARAAPCRVTNGLLLGLAGVLTLGTSLFHTLGAAIAALILVAWMLSGRRAGPSATRNLLISLAIALLVCAPVAAWFGWHLATAPEPVRFGPEAQARNAADVWQFLIHPRLRMVLCGVENDFVSLVSANNQRPILWYLPGYLLAAVGVARIARYTRSYPESPVRVFVLIGAIFWTLALGPLLKVGSPAEINPSPTPIPLPGALLAPLPMLGSMRSVWHFGFLGTICLAIPCAAAAGALIDGITDTRRRHLAAWLVAVLVGAETFPGSLTTWPDRMDGAAVYIREHAPEGASVAVLPNYLYEIRGHFMYQQTIHGHPILSGYLSRDPLDFEEWKREHAWPIDLERTGYGSLSAPDARALERLREDVQELRISHFAIYDDTEERRFSRRIVSVLEKAGMAEVVYTDNSMVVCRMLPGS